LEHIRLDSRKSVLSKNLLRFRPGAPDAMEMGIRIQQYKSS
jgi:hypothetical protein